MSEKIKRAKITELQPDPNNLNKHTQRGHTIVENSMRKRGLGRGILAAGKGVDNPVVMAGNLTLEKAVDAGFENVILVHTTGNELVVTVRDDLAPDSAEAIALAIEDNESSKQSYNPDVEVLAALAQGENAVLAALRNEDKILNSVIEGIGLPDENAGADTEPEISRADELREKWQTATGQLWQLGRHRLLCGDGTKREDVERVMGGEKVDLVITDPPYGVSYEGGTGNSKKREMLAGDDDARLYDAFLKVLPSSEDCALYLWHAGQRAKDVHMAVELNGFKVRSQIIWHKLNAHYGAWMAQYKPKHEPCFYCVKGAPKFIGATNEVTVWEYSQPRNNEHHPTQKPVELMERAVGNHPYSVVYDPFGGSGTTLIACENLNRDCRMIEISPAYCAVILERWAAHTGGTPELME